MAAAVVLLLAVVALISWIERRSHADVLGVAREVAADKPLSDESAWQLLAHDKYLILIACLVVLLNWVNSSGEYLLDRTLLAAANDAASHGVPSQQYIGAFKANYYAWYNGIGVVLQLLVVSRVLKHVGVRNALFVMPLFALGAYGFAMFLPVIAVMRLVKIGENSLQYSLQDTTRHALFLVATRVEKFVGKTAIDTIAVRIGAIMSTLVVFAGTRLGWATGTFAAIDVGLAALWLASVVWIGREHRRRSAERATGSATP
jgi:AAA family ATP:ADP antiporter